MGKKNSSKYDLFSVVLLLFLVQHNIIPRVRLISDGGDLANYYSFVSPGIIMYRYD